jgi:hypothetical protein
MSVTIELDTTEIVKLISICNAAITSEETTLRYLSDDSAAAQHSKTSIVDTTALKEKLKKAIFDGI